MRPDRWSRVKDVFEAALHMPPTERAAYLEGLSELDPEMRSEVERLLDAHRDDSFLEHLPEPEVETGEGTAPPRNGGAQETHVGPYRLLEEIGRGGMGTVHLAVRDDDEYKKRVAVKLLRKGMDTDDVVRRFRSERQILAAVEHSYIAKLYDGGTTDHGSPYFVMELVEGLPLDEYCDTRRLSIHDRLELFRKVCVAVQVAHQNLVVHRDLKPSNILVTADGEPKLLDFGIAKLLNPEHSSTTVDPTQLHARLMTPAYASPEQVRGEPVTTATDVYSLGVVLYELLTGHRPYRVASQAPAELARVVCESEPTRPSQMIARQYEASETDGTPRPVTPESVSRNRGDSPDKLRRRLSGDLDNIVMMVLRKEPQRRYASVDQLSEDIRRHLEGRPVRARKATLAYRASKFVRRHRVSLAAGAFVIASLVGVILVTTQAWARARQEAVRAEREGAKAQAINDFMKKTLAAADPVHGIGREVTVVEALGQAVGEIESSFSSQPEVRAAIQKTIGSTYRELGRFEEAGPLLVSALETQRRLFGEDHLDVADSLSELAALKLDQGEYVEAERLSREALRQHRELPGAETRVAEDLDSVAMALYHRGDYGAAEPLQLEAVRVLRGLGDEPTRELSEAFHNLALIVEAKGDLEGAEALYRRSLAIDRELLGNEHPEIATTLSNLGLLLRDTQGHEAAEPLLREALAVRRKVLGEHPQTAISLTALGQVLSAQGDAAGAEQLFREALGMQRRLLGDGDVYMASTLSNLARELRLVGRLDEAEPLYREAIAIRRKDVGDVHLGLAVDMSQLAELLGEKGEVDEAEALLLSSYPVLQDTLGPEHRRTKKAINRLVKLYEAWGKPDKAAEFRALLPDTYAPEG